MSKWHPLRSLLLTTSALVPLGLASALAGPQGGVVVGGGATIGGNGTNTVITQQTNNAIINWHTFNIGAGETVQFNQPGASAIALNRVIGQMGPSHLYGSLTANGRVFLVNPDGVLIGRGATINTAGFLATTHDISNENFMAGRYIFNRPGRPDASIVNNGVINAHSHGFAALVAPGVRNSGTITARFGTIGLASANSFSLDFYGDQLIKLAPGDAISATVRDVETGLPLNALVKNEGLLKANGGRVELTAAAARTVVDSVINNTGVIEARSVGSRNGKIVLGASTGDNGGYKQTVKVSGKLDVSSKKAKGGKIQVTGEAIEIVAATFDASGATGGGTVLIGGDTGGGHGHWATASIPQAGLEPGQVPNATTVSIDAGTVINASATSVGNGGKVIVWADGTTTYSGLILAKGGAQGGDGGFVEVSGKDTLDFRGMVNTSAPFGMTGTLLLDPLDYTVGIADGANSMSSATLQGLLAVQNVTIVNNAGAGNGDIFVVSNVTWSASTTLTLNAFRNVTFAAVVSNTGAGNLIVRADVTGTGTGRIIFDTFGNKVDWSASTGKVTFYDNPVSGSYATPTDFTPTGQGSNKGVIVNPAVSGQFQYFMLVNSIANFQNMALNTSANYALGKNIDAGGASMNGLTFTFQGVFDGLGNTISNLVINGPAALASNSGIIRNLNLTNLTVQAGGNNQLIGLLVGQNLAGGQIVNVDVTGTVNGGNFSGIIAGGLAGRNAGTITDSTADVDVTVGNGVGMGLSNFAGGLVGINTGTIFQSAASGDVTAGSNAAAGGLVGQNGNGGPSGGNGFIDFSGASGDVTSAGSNVALGGLVGFNRAGSVIRDSIAVGDVTGNGTVQGCSNNSSACQPIDVGGLVGFNQGRIESFRSPYLTYALGDVFVGSNGSAGGLVGSNSGIVYYASAFGDVTGASGSGSNKETALGGLVGHNLGGVFYSIGNGDVGSSSATNIVAGGAIGNNSGYAIVGATGNVSTGNFGIAGGAIGTNEANNCGNCQPPGDGSAFYNTARIEATFSLGGVSVGSASIGGGLVGVNDGFLFDSFSLSSVIGAGNSILGGLVGVNDLQSLIDSSFAVGNVTSTGPNSWVGGFVGYNAGAIFDSANGYHLLGGVPSSLFGNVTASTQSVVGGFAGMNIGTIANSSAVTTISTTGGGNVIGGFAGANFGSLINDTAGGSIAASGANIVGGLVGANGKLNAPSGSSSATFASLAAANTLPVSSFPTGTITNSNASVSITSGPGSIVNSRVGVTNPSTLPGAPAIILSCDADVCTLFTQSQLVGGGTSTIPNQVIAIPNQAFTNPPPIHQPPAALIQLTQPPGAQPPGGQPPGPGQQQHQTAANTIPGTPPVPVAPPRPFRPVAGIDGELRSNIPPLNENRFVQNEVVMQILEDTPDDVLRRIAQQLGLTVLSNESLGSIRRRALRLRLPSGVSVREVIRRLEANRVVAVAQPNYTYRVVQAQPSTNVAQAVPQAIPPTATTVPRGDPAQYMMGKLNLPEAHRVASGSNVAVAVIDSEVDREHAELSGTVAERFDATDSPSRAHSHGTAMAGAIVSRDRLLGVAPGARILAVRAFSETQTTAESTTFTILKSIEWAVSRGARVINMSFAGPYDPSLERALKEAAAKGVIMIAASGNAGPKSPPLWPSADPNVIAVTATDSGDRLFKQANRGAYVSVASPGVEILAPAPQAGYQMSTGTSIATAHVSGIVALMLERDPTLTPRDVRLILETTAQDLGPKGRDVQFGWGLVNPQRALAMVEERKRQRGSAAPAPAAPVQR